MYLYSSISFPFVCGWHAKRRKSLTGPRWGTGGDQDFFSMCAAFWWIPTQVTTLCLVAEACGQLGRSLVRTKLWGSLQSRGDVETVWRLEMSRASRFGLSSSFLRAAEENVVAALQEKDGRFDILSNVDGVRKHVSENKNVKVRKR